MEKWSPMNQDRQVTWKLVSEDDEVLPSNWCASHTSRVAPQPIARCAHVSATPNLFPIVAPKPTRPKDLATFLTLAPSIARCARVSATPNLFPIVAPKPIRSKDLATFLTLAPSPSPTPTRAIEDVLYASSPSGVEGLAPDAGNEAVGSTYTPITDLVESTERDSIVHSDTGAADATSAQASDHAIPTRIPRTVQGILEDDDDEEEESEDENVEAVALTDRFYDAERDYRRRQEWVRAWLEIGPSGTMRGT